MSLTVSLRAEIKKIRRTSVFYICILGAAFVPVISFLEARDGDLHSSKKASWTAYYNGWEQGMSFMFLPLFVILVTTLLLQLEYRNNTWKQVLAAPQKLSAIFFSKFLVLQLLLLAFMVLYNIFFAIATWGIYTLHPKIVSGGLDLGEVLFTNVQAYLTLLAMSALQFWMSVRFKGFIASLAIGFCLWLASPIMLFEMEWSGVKFYPYALSIVSVLPNFKADLDTFRILSIIYAAMVLTLGYIDFHQRKVRSN